VRTHKTRTKNDMHLPRVRLNTGVWTPVLELAEKNGGGSDVETFEILHRD